MLTPESYILLVVIFTVCLIIWRVCCYQDDFEEIYESDDSRQPRRRRSLPEIPISAPSTTQVALRPPCISTSCPSLPNLIDSNPSIPLPSVSSHFPHFAPTATPYPPVSFQSNSTAPSTTPYSPHSYTNTSYPYPSAPSYQETFLLPQQKPEDNSQDDTDLPPSFDEVMGLLAKKREQ